MSLRDQILSTNDAPLHPVTVPEWGNATVYLPVMTLADGDALKKAGDDATGLALFVIRDADGTPLFTEADRPALAKKALVVVNRLVGDFNRLNGFGEDPAKNSQTIPASVSS